MHVNEVAEQGYTIVEDAIEPDFVDALNDDLLRLERVLRRSSPSPNSFEGHHTLRIYNLLAFGALYERIPVHEHVLPIVEGVLDPGCLISSLSSISILPGETAQPIHADDQLIPLPKPHPPTVCNSMWALTDFTEANGATRLVPGSHLCGPLARLRQARTTRSRPRCRRARCSIWHGSLWHGGGANTTDDRRVGIAMNYCAGYIRQQENQQLGLPRETVDRLRTPVARARRLQRLQHADRPHQQALARAAAPRADAPDEQRRSSGTRSERRERAGT